MPNSAPRRMPFVMSCACTATQENANAHSARDNFFISFCFSERVLVLCKDKTFLWIVQEKKKKSEEMEVVLNGCWGVLRCKMRHLMSFRVEFGRIVARFGRYH